MAELEQDPLWVTHDNHQTKAHSSTTQILVKNSEKIVSRHG